MEPLLIKPGSGVLDGTRIPAYQNTWSMTAAWPDGRVTPRGMWYDEVSINSQGDIEILKREQRILYSNGQETLQVETVNRNTMQHLSLQIGNRGEALHTDLHYESNWVRGKKMYVIGGGAPLERLSGNFSIELEEPFFDWHLWGLLVAACPLELGFSGRFLAHESYSYLPGDFRWVTLRVAGTETIDCGSWGEQVCFVVSVAAEVPWKLWIAVRTDVARVQQICISYIDGSELWWRPELQQRS
ncbi:hypothetical protein C7T94_07695 [Pedobacter yulinensis]|uniref:Uncharacterized protein n=1 Tax=Pedobacter yulinensis TaxID=2126353 RepID=A0A2T3HJB9_9SPHI|nr:hypothetical protein [Pedobacter yulinensis]PST82546.1 hypothetical protein C7T94_07695 [Pedobacter yulinensis]